MHPRSQDGGIGRKDPIAGPGYADFKKLFSHLESSSEKEAYSKAPTLPKSKGGAIGGGRRVKAESNQNQHEREVEGFNGVAQDPDPKEEQKAVKPAAVLEKIGWTFEKTLFNSDSEVFAEYQIHSEDSRTLVEFQLLLKSTDGYKVVERAQAHADEKGLAKVKFPIRKTDAPKANFTIKSKHGSTEWSSGQGTEREVGETAEVSFERTQVSGIHFPKDKSFIADGYINGLCELKNQYLEWKKNHESAQIIVYGHSEADKDGEPFPISRNRALSTFAFILGEVDQWAAIGEKEKWGVWEQQIMLRGLGYFDAKPTGYLGTITRKSIQKFIEHLNKDCGKKFNPDLGLSEAYIRKELYREYMNLRRNEFELPSSAFRLVSGFPYVGCAAFNRYQSGEELHDQNRRVVFLIVKESPNFPIKFPCRSNSTGPCENECKKPGERAIKGFRCKFYDEMVKREKVGDTSTSGNGHEIETHWKSQSGSVYARQNDFNDDVLAAANKYDIEPLLLKSLIAQESAFNPMANNSSGFAGLTQVGGDAIEEAGLNKGSTKKEIKTIVTNGEEFKKATYIYDFKCDERFDTKKSIYAGALIFSHKRKSINKLIFSKFKTPPSDSEKEKFYIASYNAGEGTVLNAWKENG
jgi:hypothetical protein